MIPQAMCLTCRAHKSCVCDRQRAAFFVMCHPECSRHIHKDVCVPTSTRQQCFRLFRWQPHCFRWNNNVAQVLEVKTYQTIVFFDCEFCQETFWRFQTAFLGERVRTSTYPSPKWSKWTKFQKRQKKKKKKKIDTWSFDLRFNWMCLAFLDGRRWHTGWGEKKKPRAANLAANVGNPGDNVSCRDNSWSPHKIDPGKLCWILINWDLRIKSSLTTLSLSGHKWKLWKHSLTH